MSVVKNAAGFGAVECVENLMHPAFHGSMVLKRVLLHIKLLTRQTPEREVLLTRRR